MSTERRIVLAAGSVEVRHQLGATAWVVFEQLLLESTSRGDVCEASVSVRSLAAQLGLSKDTVARAVTRLRRAGLVEASQSRAATGAFATGCYRLCVPDSITVTDHTLSTPPTSACSSLRTRSSRSTSQLALAIDP